MAETRDAPAPVPGPLSPKEAKRRAEAEAKAAKKAAKERAKAEKAEKKTSLSSKDVAPPSRRPRLMVPIRLGLPRPTRSLLLALGAALGLVALAAIMLTVVTQPFKVAKQSMDPSLAEDQVILVWRIPYMGPFTALGGPQRGQIIIFRDPQTARPFVKRVIALPGETVEGREGIVWVNGQPFDELYLPGKVRTDDFGPYAVENDTYFVLGDNRRPSLDSRHFGAVPRESVIGVAVLSVSPGDRLGTFTDPVADTVFQSGR